MPLSKKQLAAAKTARIKWGAFFILGPDDKLPELVKMDGLQTVHRRIVGNESAWLEMIKGEYKDEP